MDASSFNKSFNNLSLSLSQSSSSQTLHQDFSKTTNSSLSASKSEWPRRTTVASDRFIDDRSNFEMAQYLLRTQGQGVKGSTLPVPGDPNPPPIVIDGRGRQIQSSYTRSLNKNVLGVSELASSRVLNYAQRPKSPQDAYHNVLKVLYQDTLGSHTTKGRVVPMTPDLVLETPYILDDFYLNVLDWSKQNVIGMGLDDLVVNASNEHKTRIPIELQNPPSLITHPIWRRHRVYRVGCVAFIQDGTQLACSIKIGGIQIWDVNSVKWIQTLKNGNKYARIPSISSTLNGRLLSEGNQLGHLRHHDLRIKDPSHLICSIRKAHLEEICGLKWSPDGRYLASGAKDHIVNIWDSRNMTNSAKAKPVCTFKQHLAPVKALSWSPWQYNILASGGDTKDSTIKLWNVSNGSLLTSVGTGNQVSGLLWNEDYRELLSSNGCQMSCWKYPNMAKVGEIKGHPSPILHMCISPDDTTVATVSAGADETLRLWKVYPSIKSSKNVGESKDPLLARFRTIR